MKVFLKRLLNQVFAQLPEYSHPLISIKLSKFSDHFDQK